jgi:large subunit ribosomal protein L15e
MNNYIQLKKTHASCISQNFQRRGIAPVIATLLLVAIAVVGGSIVFVFAQEFFTESQISGTPSIELIKIIGYDASDAEQVKAHDGIDILPTNCCGESDGLKNADERITIYLQNNGVKQVFISVIKGVFFKADMPSLQDKVWIRLWNENSPDLRDRVIGWRKQNAILRIDKPSRIQRARRLGYKAKQGIVVVRMRVGTGGMRKQRPRGGRRPKHLGVTRIKADDSMKTVAVRRVLERYPNMKLLGSYFVYKDGIHYWFEIILADPQHPRIAQDKELRNRVGAPAA